jgi:aryl-alcohol dehydrogenase-like predicted oxidoreductase
MVVSNINKLALGTAQFGLSYGISNQSGQMNLSEAKKILGLAGKAKVNLLDTAIAYGDSEKVLGKIGVTEFNVVSKLPSLPEGAADIDSWVEDQIKGSLNRLCVPSLFGLLLHRSENLLGKSGKKLIEALNRVKSKGLVKKVGVSIYNPSELEEIMPLMRIDLVQAPLNVIDRRIETSGWLSRLHLEGVEVHTRSAFLQGLLLMPRNKIPVKFETWATLWDSWALELEENNLSAAAACLSYPLSLPEVDRVVVGVESMDQLNALIAASQIHLPQLDFSFMASEDRMLINPSNWSALCRLLPSSKHA